MKTIDDGSVTVTSMNPQQSIIAFLAAINASTNTIKGQVNVKRS